jgi:hypothetical protein
MVTFTLNTGAAGPKKIVLNTEFVDGFISLSSIGPLINSVACNVYISLLCCLVNAIGGIG